jgi:hypothetical protein
MRYVRALAAARWTERVAAVAGIGRDRSVWVRAVPSATKGTFDVNEPLPGAAKPLQDWFDLGGDFAYPPALASWQPGRLDVFGIGQDGAMYHRYWQSPDGWTLGSAWQNLGGKFTSPPLVVATGANQLDIFGLGQGRSLFHKRWDGTWHPGEREWTSLGGTFSATPEVRALHNGSTLVVAGAGMDGSMYFTSRSSGHWRPEGWTRLGGQFSSLPALVDNSANIDVLGLGQDSDVYRRHLVDAKMPDPYYGWQPMHGACTSAPAVGRLARGGDDGVVFVLGQDLGMYHLTYTVGHQELVGAVEWLRLGGVFTSAPSIVETSDQRIDVFGLGRNAGVWHRAWNKDGWEPHGSWQDLGGRFLHGGPSNSPVPIVATPDGHPTPPASGGTLTLSLDDVSPEFDVYSATWQVWAGLPTGPVPLPAAGGTSVTFTNLNASQYYVYLDVRAYNTVTQEVEASWFRGTSNGVPGFSTHVFRWNGTSQSHRFALRSEQSADRPDVYSTITLSN